MSITLNHTIVWCRDHKRSADFLTGLLGLPPATVFGPFQVVPVGETSLDFKETEGPIASQHYAFLVSEAEFDEIFGRIQAQGLEYWADPMRSRPGRINRNDGGRGVYFPDPDDHVLEIITRPYGSGD